MRDMYFHFLIQNNQKCYLLDLKTFQQNLILFYNAEMTVYATTRLSTAESFNRFPTVTLYSINQFDGDVLRAEYIHFAYFPYFAYFGDSIRKLRM